MKIFCLYIDHRNTRKEFRIVSHHLQFKHVSWELTQLDWLMAWSSIHPFQPWSSRWHTLVITLEIQSLPLSSIWGLIFLKFSVYIYTYLSVTFQPGDAIQNSTLHFLRLYFNLRFFFFFFFFENFIEYGIIFVIFQI